MLSGYLLFHHLEVARYRLLGEYVIAGHPLDYAALHIPGKVNELRYPGRFIEHPPQYRQSVLVAVLRPVYQSHEFLLVLDQLRGAFVVLGRAMGFLWAHVSTSILPCCAGDTRRRARPPGPEDPKPQKVPPQELLGRRALLALPSSVPPALPYVRAPRHPFLRPALRGCRRRRTPGSPGRPPCETGCNRVRRAPAFPMGSPVFSPLCYPVADA